MNRKDPFVTNEYYHCYNRGVDKRVVFLDAQDFDYFLTALELFNREDSLGGMMEYSYPANRKLAESSKVEKLVNIYAFCLNPNHYHLLLQPNFDHGIQKYMQKVNTGYTMYFNKKYERSGSLFQGRYKSSHISTDEYLKHILAYISLNNEVHTGIDHQNYRSNLTSGGKYKKVFDPSLIRDLFDSTKKFESYARKKLPYMVEQKETLREIKDNFYIE